MLPRTMKRLRKNLVLATRRLSESRSLLPLTALLLRSHTVRPSALFFARELCRRRGVSVYRLRETSLRVVIRHGTGDVVTLGEVFHERDYRPPSGAGHVLAQPRNIVDLGANIGLFGVFAAAQWPEAEILAFEPDPANAAVHEQTISSNGLQGRWKLIRAAAGAADRHAAFATGQIALSHLSDGQDDGPTIEVPVRDVLARVANADLLKMDIEGGEWEILNDPRFRAAPPRVLVLEYHPRLCPGLDPRDAAESALHAAGLRLHPLWHRADGHGMLWAWQS
jgi:FkbM family methyltransferase